MNKLKSKVISMSLLLGLCVSAILTASVRANSDNGSDSSYDQSEMPINQAQVEAKLQSAVNDPVQLYTVIRQAARHGLELCAYNEMKQLATELPNNANVLASLCFAYDIVSGQYNINWNRDLLTTTAGVGPIDYDYVLNEASKLNPKLWIIYLLKAHSLEFPFDRDRSSALSLFQKAVEYGPTVPYTHCEFGLFYLSDHHLRAQDPLHFDPNDPVIAPTRSELAEAAFQFVEAEKLTPVDADAPWYLLETYPRGPLTRDQALAAKQTFLNEVPPGYALSSMTRNVLAQPLP